MTDQETTNTDTKEANKLARASAIHDLVHGKAVYVLSFLVPLIIMIAVFIIRDIYPFGEQCYLRSDMYHQYCPFFSELWEKIRNGGSLSYSWNIGMGTNFTALYGYYLSSPINWIIALFPQKYMIEVMNTIIILKIAVSGFTCTYYLCKHNKKRHLSAAIFGMFYALSAFIAAYSWNLMWLDCVLLLPLIVLGLERLVNEGKGILYAVSLGLAILSNYYIAIMICISMVIYFAVIMVSRPVPKDKTEYARSALRFILYSLLAGGLAAILLIPEVCALSYTASGDVNFPDTLSRYFSFVTIIKRHLMNVEVSIGLDHLPNIYCGVAVLVLFPLYIMTKKIPLREKIMKVIALVIFFTAFNMNIPNFIWHGFHYPNSLPCRQSFIYIFLLLGICYDAFCNIKEYKNSQIAGSFWGVVLFLVYLGNTLTSDDIDFRVIYLSALFIAIYVLLAIIARKKKKWNLNYIMVALFAVAIVECTTNMENTGYSTTSRTAYLTDYESVGALVDEVEEIEDENSFYRISKVWGYRTKNDSAWHHYKGESTFSSTSYAAMSRFFGDLGLEHSTNSYAINGATPLVNSIFNVKYFLSNRALEGDKLYTLVDTYDNEYLYENNYTLPLGFMLPSDFNSNWNVMTEPNPFSVQNSFAMSAAGIDELFTRITFDDMSTSATINIVEDEYLYLYIMNKTIDTINVSYEGHSDTYKGINHGRMVDLGYVKAGQTVYVTSSSGDKDLQMYAYVLNIDKLDELYKALADEGFNVTSYDDTHVTGTITALSDGLMWTSIPYDEGYTVYVDGKETEYTSVDDKALIAVNLTKGTHTVEFRYEVRGLKAGMTISIICLIIIAGCIVFRIKYKKEITEEGALSLLTSHNKKTSGKDDTL